MLLRLPDRYLLREMLVSFAAAAAMLPRLGFGDARVDVMSGVARGGAPRPRDARTIAAVPGCLVYANLTSLGRGLLPDGALRTWLDFWWVHGLVIAFALLLLVRGDRVPRQRAALAAPA